MSVYRHLLFPLLYIVILTEVNGVVNKNACVPCTPSGKENAWKYLFARSAIIEHLKCIGPSEGFVFCFESLGHADFRQYLEAARPYFVMCHDGAELAVYGEYQEDGEEIKEPEGEEDDGDDDLAEGGDSPDGAETGVEQEMLLKRRILEWMSLGFNVALINELEFRDSKVRPPYSRG